MAKNISTTIVLKVNGKDVENSFRGLSKEVRSLENELKELTPGTERFMRKAAELKEVKEHFSRVKGEIDAVSGRLKESEGFLGKFRSKLSDIGLSFGNILAGLGVAGISQTASELLKISDAMADVQKTTGMAREEVKQLWDAFDDMNTRTSKMDRLKIAEVGGRLGVPKEEMAKFVQEIDKAYVALGDSFDGGLEGVVDSLGKIKGLFEETKGQSYADAINGVGSALNELAASGTASEGNISDFALRVGALPDALKPSIDKVLGLGAAFEESGVDSQIAASGYSNFMKVAGENLSAFAYSMNISVKEAQELFNTKPEEFFLKFAEGMKGLNADETAKVFDSLKINSLEVQKAVGAAANRTEGFRTAMERAGGAMADATSLSEEFNKKNNNAAAVWEKIKNTIADTFTQTNFINFFEGIIFFIGNLVGVTNEAGNSVNTFKEKLIFLGNIIKVVVAGFVGYQAVIIQTAILEGNYTKAKWLGIIADKAQALAHSVKNSVMAAYNGILTILKLKTDRATASTIAFNAASKVTPWGALVALITAAVAAYSLFGDEIDDVAKKQKEFNDKIKEAQSETAKEVVELDKLYKAATDASKGKQAQLKATEELQKIYPDVFANIEKEIIMQGKAKEAYEGLRKAILNSARAKAAQRMIEENAEKYAFQEGSLLSQEEKAKEELEKAKKRKGDQTIEIGGQYFKVSQKEAVSFYESSSRSIKKQLENLHKKQEEENKEYLKVIESTPIVEGKKIDNAGGVGGNRIAPSSKNEGKKNRPAKDGSVKEADSSAEKSRDELEKIMKARLDSQRKYWDEQMSIAKEGREKEEAQEKENYNRRKEDLERENAELLTQKKKNTEEIQRLEKARSQTKNPAAIADYNKAIADRKEVNQQIIALQTDNQNLAEQMHKTHLFNMQKISDNYNMKAYQSFVDAKQKEIEMETLKSEEEIQQISSLEEAKLELSNLTYLALTEEELNQIRTLEEAKKVLREEANRRVLIGQLEAVKEQKKELEKLLKDESFSPEAREKLKKDLEEVDAVITRIKGTIQGNEEGDEAKQNAENKKKKESIDVLGFSAAQWEDMFANLDTTEGKIRGIIMAAQALSNAFQMFSKLQHNLNDRELKRFTQNQDKKKLALLQQLNEGYISQEQYHKGLQSIEEETAEKKRRLQERAAKAEKAANIMSAITGTASAVVGALGMKPFTPANIVLAGIVGALGAVQIATVASTPIPEFNKGGFTGGGFGSPDSSGFRPAGIVHENEYVTPKWMLQNPVVADVVDWMESIRTGRTQAPRGYAEGGFTGGGQTSGADAQTPATAQMVLGAEMQPILSDLKQVLSELKENGVEAWMVENAENGKRLKNAIKQFENIEKRNARK